MKSHPSLRSRGLASLWAAGIFAFLAGCTTRTQFTVRAAANQALVQPQTYVLENANPSTPNDGLRFQETVEIMKSALGTRSLYEAPDRASADVIIRVETRVEGPLLKLLETSETYYTGKAVNSESNMEQLVNFRDETIELLYYETRLTLTALEAPAAPGAEATLVWKVEVSVESEMNDLRAVLPALASLGAASIGSDTEGEVETTVRQMTNRVRPVGMQPGIRER